jgi:hypothetical protein
MCKDSIRLAAAGAGLAVALLLAGARAPLAAQDPPGTATLSINGGLMRHDVGVAGTDPIFVFRADNVVTDLSVVELAVGYAYPDLGFGRDHFLLGEGQLQLQAPLGRIAPYFGLGGGIVRLADEATGPATAEELVASWRATFGLGAGLRVWLDDRTRVRTDLRFRGIQANFDRTSLEWTVGLGLRW